MNKSQASLIAIVMLAALFYVLPMLLEDLSIGFDLPPFGYITLFDPNSMFGAYGFLLGGVAAIAIMYIMINERRKTN